MTTKLKVTLTPEAAAAVKEMYERGELKDIGVLSIADADANTTESVDHLNEEVGEFPITTYAQKALQHSVFGEQLNNVRITVNQEAIILTGNVSSYYLKQVAQQQVMPILRGRELQNRIIVERSLRKGNQQYSVDLTVDLTDDLGHASSG